MRIYDSVAETIGNTPLVRVSTRFLAEYGVSGDLCVKTEGRNPGGSAKDRVALEMIRGAEERGELQAGGTLIEATSGNTGVGLALVAAAAGYRVILTMPENMSIERRKLLGALGAQIELTSAKDGMAGAIRRAEALHTEIENSILTLQFENADNPRAHEKTTGEEIWRDTDGTVDTLVAGVGTGGTLCGTARYLKSRNPNVNAVAIEPFESPVLSEGRAGSHGIQGIGANFVPQNFDRAVVDEILTVKTADAILAAKTLMRLDGILCGISGGAALVGGVQLLKRRVRRIGPVVAILPDTGERYLSTALFA